MAEVFAIKDVPYNLRSSNNFALPKARTNSYGNNNIKFVCQKLWQTLPREIKECQSLETFKRNIKTIKTIDCSCKLCKKFISKFRFFVIRLSSQDYVPGESKKSLGVWKAVE